MDKEYIKMILEADNQPKKKTVIESSENEEIQNLYESYFEKKQDAEFRTSNTRKQVKESLLAEAIYKIYSESLTSLQISDYDNRMMARSFINNFIEENGVDNLLRSFKSKSLLLSEISSIVDKYTDIMCEKCKHENSDEFVIDPSNKDNFYDDLDIEDAEDASAMIKTRVSSAIDNFLSDNLNSKAEIKEIIQQSQDKIQNTDNDELKESYEIDAKRKISDLEDNRTKSIFESIVFNLSKASIVNEDLKKVYFNNNRLDMDKIVETATLMYTFLETVNTCKMINVDEEYIQKILDEIR